jgi:hypothetical protein
MARLLLTLVVAIAAASCNCGGSLTGAHAEIQVVPLSIDFGNVASGSSSSRAVTVTNVGASELEVTGVRVENDARMAFSVGLARATVPVGGSVSLVVYYSAPGFEGPDGASLLIESNARSGAEVRVSLAGRSVGFVEGPDGGGDGGQPDGGQPDAGTPDAGAPDAGTPDSGTPGACAGTPVVIDFDDLAVNFVTPGYRGLTWDSDWYVYFTIAGEYYAHSGTQYVTNNLQGSPISFTFPQPVCFDGAWFSLRDNRNAHVRFDLYDAAGGLLGSSATLTQVLAPTYLPARVTGVKRVSVVFDVDFAMDDLTYVP